MSELMGSPSAQCKTHDSRGKRLELHSSWTLRRSSPGFPTHYGLQRSRVILSRVLDTSSRGTIRLKPPRSHLCPGQDVKRPPPDWPLLRREVSPAAGVTNSYLGRLSLWMLCRSSAHAPIGQTHHLLENGVSALLFY